MASLTWRVNEEYENRRTWMQTNKQTNKFLVLLCLSVGAHAALGSCPYCPYEKPPLMTEWIKQTKIKHEDQNIHIRVKSSFIQVCLGGWYRMGPWFSPSDLLRQGKSGASWTEGAQVSNYKPCDQWLTSSGWPAGHLSFVMQHVSSVFTIKCHILWF